MIKQEFEITSLMPYTKSKYVDYKGAFMYRKDKKMRWLQKICFWFLKKINAFYLENVAYVTTTIINKRDVIIKINEYLDNVDFVFDSICDTLLVGRDIYNELCYDSNIQPHSFCIDDCFGLTRPTSRPGYFNITEYRGITIIYIPWIKGVLPISIDILSKAKKEGEEK
jgi:hypothetical protein